MKKSTAVDEARQRLDARRRQLETQIQDLQDDLSRTVGWAPRRSGALVVGLAAAAGFALAFGLKRLRD